MLRRLFNSPIQIMLALLAGVSLLSGCAAPPAFNSEMPDAEIRAGLAENFWIGMSRAEVRSSAEALRLYCYDAQDVFDLDHSAGRAREPACMPAASRWSFALLTKHDARGHFGFTDTQILWIFDGSDCLDECRLSRSNWNAIMAFDHLGAVFEMCSDGVRSYLAADGLLYAALMIGSDSLAAVSHGFADAMIDCSKVSQVSMHPFPQYHKCPPPPVVSLERNG
jgi:hypothetical protein